MRLIFRLSKVIWSKYDILQNSPIQHTSNRQKSENIKIQLEDPINYPCKLSEALDIPCGHYL